jgi:hypothetical protein
VQSAGAHRCRKGPALLAASRLLCGHKPGTPGVLIMGNKTERMCKHDISIQAACDVTRRAPDRRVRVTESTTRRMQPGAATAHSPHSG